MCSYINKWEYYIMLRRRTFDQRNELAYTIHHFAVNADTREIFLSGDVDNVNKEYSEVDFISATIFLKNLRYLVSIDKDKPIFIHLMTVGGDWDAGMVMYDAISTCPSHVTIIVHGQAYSMGSVILQAADTRLMMPHANFMLHEGSIQVDNTTMKIANTTLIEANRVNEQMLDIYANRCVDGPIFKDKKVSDIKRYIKNKWDKKEDWYLSSEEVIQYGFADGIIGQTDKFNDITTLIQNNGV